MTIKIIEVRVYQDENGDDEARHADIIISDSVIHYALGVGGLLLKDDLQPGLDAREAELWTVAQRIDESLTTEEVQRELFNSPLAGGWSEDEFQDAILDSDLGQTAKITAIQNKRAAIKLDWPLP